MRQKLHLWSCCPASYFSTVNYMKLKIMYRTGGGAGVLTALKYFNYVIFSKLINCVSVYSGGQNCFVELANSITIKQYNYKTWNYLRWTESVGDAREVCCCNFCKSWTYKILKLKVNKNSTTHFIWYLLCSEQLSALFHEHYEMKSCFRSRKGQYFQICQVF